MSTLGKAIILLGVDTATFRDDVGRAVAIFERGMGAMQRSALGFKSAIAGSITVGGMIAFTKAVIDQADEVGKLSMKLGMTTEQISELMEAYRLGDGSQEGFKNGLRDFNKALVEATNSGSKAAKVFAAMGVDIKAGPHEAFRQFAEQFAKLPEGELRAAAAAEILKKSGAEWIPVLAEGAKGLDEAARKARALGDVVSADFAKQAAEFNDNLKLIQRSAVGAANSILSGGVLEVFVEISKGIERGAEKGERWLAVMREIAKVGLSTAASLPMGGALAGRAADALFQEDAGVRGPNRQVVTGKIRGAGEERSLTASMFPPDPEALRKALAESDALAKRQIAALQQMEEKRKSLFNLNEQDLMLERIRTGTYKDFDEQTKKRLMQIAREIDLRKQTQDRIDAGMPALHAEAAAMERAAQIRKDLAEQTRTESMQRDFELGQLTRTGREQEKANALFQIELDLRRQRADLARSAGEDMELFARENARLEAQAAERRKAAIADIEKRQAVERDFFTGSIQAFNEYGEAATNAAEQARFIFGNTFRNLEDALVEFTRTGKANFRDFANAVISDLIRISVRQGITGPLAQGAAGNSNASGIFGLLGSIFGGGANSGAGGAGGGVGASGGTYAAANGGIMTSSGMIPLQRYARGGVARSPQLAIFGEGRMPEAYVPLPDGRRIPVNIQGGGDGARSVNYIDARGADAAGLARLEETIRRLDGSIEHRAVSAVATTRGRGGAVARRIGGRA